MAINLTTIFGSDIQVAAQPRQAKRQHSGFSGAHGVTSMNLGTRGRLITVRGRITGVGAGYDAARANAQAYIDFIESYQWNDGLDYYCREQHYYHVVFEHFELTPVNEVIFHHSSEGKVIVYFLATLRSLI